MKPILRIFIVFTFTLPSVGLSQEQTWVRANARPIALDANGFDDLAFLQSILEGKRIVQLGENTHGTREYNLVKARIVRFLHKELGFDVLAFESDLYQCYAADLRAAEVEARSTLLSSIFGIWHTQEVLPLFEYLRNTRRTDRPLRLAGIDVQPIGRNKVGRPRFLSSAVGAVDPMYSAEVFALDSTFLAVYAKGGRERRAYFRSRDGRRMVESYERLARFIGDKENGLQVASPSPERDAIRVARQTVRSILTYIRQQTAPNTYEYVERRDKGMADNLTFLLNDLYPGSKVIVWGHNFHIRHNNEAIPPDTSMFPDVATRTMGGWIHKRYGEDVYTIGLYAYLGQSLNNNGQVYDIPPANPGSLEALFHGAGPEALFVDLSKAPRGPETIWMDRSITARFNGTTPLSMVPREQYDGILFMEKVSPRVMLYE